VSLAAAQAGFCALVRSGGDARTLTPHRRRVALTRVAGLRAKDAAALTQVPTERLAVYHELLVGGHQNMVGYALGALLGALARLQATRPRLARPETLRATVEAFLVADAGPASHSLRELAASFARFLRRRFARAYAASPLFNDLERYELAELAVDLQADGAGRLASEADLARLAGGTLDRLLRTRVLIPSSTRLLAFRSDVPSALRLLRGEGAATVRWKELEIAGPSYAAVARDPLALAPHRVDLDAAAFKDLRAAGTAGPFRLEALALRRSRRGPRGESEAAAAARVAAEAFGWIRGGVLALA
jgi:hypothetical protein